MQIQKSETPIPSRPATTGNKAKPPVKDPLSFAQREISPLPGLQSRVEISPKGSGSGTLDFLNMTDLDFEPSAPTLGEILKLNSVAQTENTDHFYINGIRTPRASAQADADFLTGLLRKEYTKDLKQAGFPEAHPLSSDASIRQAEIAQVDFELLYNPSAVEGGRELLGSLQDVEEALRNLGGFETDIAAATADRFYATLSQGRHLFVAAHSQGGAITADALRQVEARLLKQHSRAEVKQIFEQKVTVQTMGGFAPDESFPAGVNIESLKNSDDYVPKLGKAIYEARRPQEPAKVVNAYWRLLQTIGSATTSNLGQLVFSPSRVMDDHATHTKTGNLGYLNQIEDSVYRTRLPSFGFRDLPGTEISPLPLKRK
jgi:hypothetical protein